MPPCYGGYGLGYYGKREAEPKAAADPWHYGGYGYGGYGLRSYGLGYGYGGLYYGKREADAAKTKAVYYDGLHSIEKVLNFLPF